MDYRRATIGPAERAMLDYAVKLTARPSQMSESDLRLLREHGFSDQAILHIAEITAYYAFANRIADGLGIELETFWGERDGT